MKEVISMAKLIVLDPGHGGFDSGGVNGERMEKDDVLDFGLALRDSLQDYGFDVIMTRDTDEFLSLSERAKISNSLNPAYFVSIHRNSFANPASNGVETWVYTNPSQQSVNLANNIQDNLVEVGVQTDRGVKRGNFLVLRETSDPAVLLELGFITNDVDNELFDERFDEYVDAVARGIAKTAGVNVPTTLPEIGGNPVAPIMPTNPNSEQAPMYRVQAGAYRELDNARDMQNRLVKSGFDAIVVRGN